MAELIDILLVGLSVGIAVWAVLKYFWGLERTPKDQPISCGGGCSSSCHEGLDN